ncbi:MAG: signal recognition particle-docking protein FtsY [Akkermansia sp.]|nr:signal recognition particle-docking protein FtsY [Akkermansia sp.]MBR1977995.1 signal recognition particle-docking protein FtsY [Akkermansia sp.]
MANFFTSLIDKFLGEPQIDWDELEADLISADIGAKRVIPLVEDLREKDTQDACDIADYIKAQLRSAFPATLPQLPTPQAGKPAVLMMVGVNGAGKTTTSAKLAYRLQKQGYKVLLAAADTFRAAAVEQLDSWATRLGVPLYKGQPNQDPASVCYEAHTRAMQQGVDYLICDTAGRLHTRHNLMEELSKIRRSLGKQDAAAPHACYLVVDATTGGNALMQAREFHKATPLSAVVITKMDGSGKGGVAVAIQDELGISPIFLGTGEGKDDIRPFNPTEYANTLL